MRTLPLAAGIAVLSTLGFIGAAHAEDTSATMEKMKGQTKALVEKGKGQTKGADEDVKGNKTSTEVEGAIRTAKAETERAQGKAVLLGLLLHLNGS